MTFSDAWYDGAACLDSVEARRIDVSSEFLLGLRTRSFIPLLRGRFSDVLERWPWDVIVAVQEEREPRPSSLSNLTELGIGLGSGFTAGVDCDLVVDVEGIDPGAIIRQGDIRRAGRNVEDARALEFYEVSAVKNGLFFPNVAIGDVVDRDAVLGFVGDAAIASPIGGRIKGVARHGLATLEGAPIVEIARSKSAQVSGVSPKSQLVSRGAAFAIEMDSEGMALLPFEAWFSR